MSEEIENASLVVPRSILTTYILNGVVGFAMLMAVLLSIQDIDAALKSPTNYPFMQILFTATNSVGGTIVMTAIIATMEICATTSSLAAASRQLWSFSRDQGVPGWGFISQVDSSISYTMAIYSFLETYWVKADVQWLATGRAAYFSSNICRRPHSPRIRPSFLDQFRLLHCFRRSGISRNRRALFFLLGSHHTPPLSPLYRWYPAV